MTSKTVLSVAFAAGCALAMGATTPAKAEMYPGPYAGPMPVETHLVTNGPQAGSGDVNWSARRNNAESAQYDRLLRSNAGFRQSRMRKECGPISDPQLRSQCVASFSQYEPTMAGSSSPPRHRQHPRGAGY